MIFQLDTSGAVGLIAPISRDLRNFVRWSDLSPFAQGYGHATAQALYERLISEGWSEPDAAAAVAFSRWAPEALALILRDCEAYEASGRVVGLWRGDADQGAHFWRWRSRAADQFFPPLRVFLSDEGKVCLALQSDHRQ